MNLNTLFEKLKNNKKQITINIFIFLIAMSITIITIVPAHPETQIISPQLNSDKSVLQIILSPDCHHCQIANSDIFKNLDILSDKYTLNLIYVGNIDSQKLHIVGVPTFILYKDGIEINRVVGFLNTTTLIQELEP